MNWATLATVLAVVVTVAGGFGAYFVARRQNTGKVSESSADILWKQSQSMYIDAVKERDRAIEQRDRLMSAQADQVIPILSAVLQAVHQIGSTMDIVNLNSQRIDEVSGKIGSLDEKLEKLVRKYG